MSAVAEILGARRGRVSFGRAGRVLVPLLTVAVFLGLWELVCRTGVVSQSEIPAMTTTVKRLWDAVTTNTAPETAAMTTTRKWFWDAVPTNTDHEMAGLGDPATFWVAVGRTVRSWAIGLTL